MNVLGKEHSSIIKEVTIMKMAKRIFAAACALSLACSMAACGSSSSDSSSSKKEAKAMTDDQKEQVNALQDKLPDIELSNKTIKWMAHYDINPSDGKSESPAISLFQTKYGGKIEYVQTTWDNRYTDLAKAVMANDSPDSFPADDMDAFPKGAIKAMFEPIDDVVDFSSDIWSSSQTLNDSFVFNGKHYVAAIDVRPQYVCTYNTKTISDFGYDDPAELYANDEWTWSKFTEMCLDFADSEADRYALDGYWYGKALNDTCGYPLIGLEDGKLVNNMGKAEVGTVQDLMYNLEKNNVVFDRSSNNWKTRGDGANGEGLGSQLTLFIPIGTWALEDTPEKTKTFGSVKDGEVMFVPMPRMDDSDKYYVSTGVNGYLLCKNAPNPDGFKQLKNDYGWTDDMIEMRKTIYDLARQNPVFDFQDGVSAELSTLMQTVNQATMITGGGATTWTECVAENQKAVDYIIKEANANVAE